MDQQLALGIMHAGHNVMLTGPAGSGKTYVLQEFISQAKRSGKYVAVTATTGLAASHLGGSTIHAWSGLGINDAIPHRFLHHLTKTRRDIIEKTDVLIIDEVSMLHDFRLDLIEEVARMVRESDQPFGGIQVILCGDFFQLPPINRDENKAGGFVVGAKTWEKLNPVVCYLGEQHRQNDDVFLEILDAMRAQDLRRRHVEALIGRQSADLSAQEAVTELHTTNVDVDQINKARLAELEGVEHHYQMAHTGKAHFVESLQRSCLAPEDLVLKKGALVMCVKNSPKREYVNGSLGVVKDFEEETDLPIVQLNNGRTITMKQDTWELRDGTRKKASLAQIPLRLAWAITVHKSQGMTLDAARIDLRKAFVEGMGYVALSRVKGLDSLSLVGINKMALQVSPEALEIDSKLRSDSGVHAEKFEHLRGRAEAGPSQTKKTVGTGEWAEKLEKMRKEYPNAYRPWKPEDDARLGSLFLEGKSVKELTNVFERHPGSIRSRLKKLLGEDVFAQ